MPKWVYGVLCMVCFLGAFGALMLSMGAKSQEDPQAAFIFLFIFLLPVAAVFSVMADPKQS